MKLFKTLILLAVVISSFTSANDMEITAKDQFILKDSKQHVYAGNVIMSFAGDNLQTKSTSVSLQNGTRIMEGDVEIILTNAVAKTQKVTFIPSKQGFVAKMDKVIFTYK